MSCALDYPSMFNVHMVLRGSTIFPNESLPSAGQFGVVSITVSQQPGLFMLLLRSWKYAQVYRWHPMNCHSVQQSLRTMAGSTMIRISVAWSGLQYRSHCPRNSPYRCSASKRRSKLSDHRSSFDLQHVVLDCGLVHDDVESSARCMTTSAWKSGSPSQQWVCDGGGNSAA